MTTTRDTFDAINASARAAGAFSLIAILLLTVGVVGIFAHFPF